ncbi:MAG: hypothetical protein EA350_04075 [Gemmatimonadales bacterium]|nr:MAG: hypothetical protein EA350_04075 [Gemmatimonadales bacterium]
MSEHAEGERVARVTRPRSVQAAERTPPPPAPVLLWVERFGGGSPGGTSLVDRGAHALTRALVTPSGKREAAWALLAADALLTWAVEDAADAPEPAAVLEEILRSVQGPRDRNRL